MSKYGQEARIEDRERLLRALDAAIKQKTEQVIKETRPVAEVEKLLWRLEELHGHKGAEAYSLELALAAAKKGNQ